MTDQPYLLDNAWREGRDRLDAVEALLDPGSIALLDRIGIEPGWTCLELGAGVRGRPILQIVNRP